MKKIIAGLAAVGMIAFATPALADVNSSNISFGASNSGAIINVTGATADTGGNTAGGSRGGRGGSGGEVEADGAGDYNNGGAKAGNGGNGGNASAGGLVETGDANADAGSINKLNSNDVVIGGGDDDCGCDDLNSSYIGGQLDNEGFILDVTVAGATSGDNDARGSRGGSGGRGGDVEAEDGDDSDYNNGGATSGHGGAGGAGGIGGEVRTGEANSNAGSINVMNSNLIRVRI